MVEAKSKSIGLALSGGGFRATLFHLGLVRALSDAGELANVRRITCVSGGSIFAAHLVLHWEEYVKGGEHFDRIVQPLLKILGHDVRGRLVRRLAWSFLRRQSLTDRLEVILRHQLFRTETLDHLGKPGRPELFILTTNSSRGARAHFTDSVICLGPYDPDDPEKGYVNIKAETCPISLAVAASAAFPGLFRPLKLTREKINADAAELRTPDFLTDGGVWDNLGLRCLMERNEEEAMDLNIVSNARAHFDWDPDESFSALRNMLRSSDIMMERIRELEKEYALKLDAADHRLMIVDIQAESPEGDGNIPAAAQRTLCKIRTDLDRFSIMEIDCLVRHGYCLAHHVLSLPAPFTPWTPYPKEAADLHGCEDDAELVSRLREGSKRQLRLLDPWDWLSWLAVLCTLALIGAAAGSVLAHFFPDRFPALAQKPWQWGARLFTSRPVIVGFWNAEITWTDDWKTQLVSEAKFSVDTLTCTGVVCFGELPNGTLIGTSHWELKTWEFSLAVLSLELGQIKLDEQGRLQEMVLTSLKRGKVFDGDGKVVDFRYGQFRQYSVTFDQSSATRMGGVVWHVEKGKKEAVGRVELTKINR